MYKNDTKRYNNMFGIFFNVGTIISGNSSLVYKIAFEKCSKL